MKSSAGTSSRTIEQQWVDIIVRSFIKDMDINPCVFQIPKSLRDTNPEAYTPRQIGLGPYRKFRPEFTEMESQKCFAVRKFLNKEQNLGFKHVVFDRIEVLEPIIRACYDKYLDFDGNTLAWMMSIDGLFLLQFVSIYVQEDQKNDAVANVDVQSLAMDIMMLENQIPIIILKELCSALQLQSSNPKNNWLLNALYLFFKDQSPLKLSEESIFQSDFGQVHLLDYMYQMIVNHQIKKEPTCHVSPIDKPKKSFIKSGISSIFRKTKGALVTTTTGITKIASNSVAVAQMALDISAAFGLKGAIAVQHNLKLLQGMRQMLPSSIKFQKSEENDQALPSLDEIDIPTVSELWEISKIQFKITPGGIRDVEFDNKQKIFYLPVITLNANSEVVLRNLVAYEAELAKSGSSLELTEYVDLMCGLIDTAKDASLLRKVGIIEGTLSDETIAQIFNGIKKSTGNMDNKSTIETVVKKVNEQWHIGRHRKKHRKIARSSL